jgi:hypothetical protein
MAAFGAWMEKVGPALVDGHAMRAVEIFELGPM